MKSKVVFAVSLFLSCIAAAEGDCAGLKFVQYPEDGECPGEGTEVDKSACYLFFRYFEKTCRANNGILDADKCTQEGVFDEVWYAKYSCDEKAITATKFEDDKCTIPKKDFLDKTENEVEEFGDCTYMYAKGNVGSNSDKFRYKISTTLSTKTEELAAAAADVATVATAAADAAAASAAAAEAAATSRAHILKAALASIILGASSLMS